MNDAASEPGTTGDGAAPRISLGKGRALVAVPRPAPRPDPLAGLGRSHALVAAGVAAVMGIGFAAGTAALASRPQGAMVAQAQMPVTPPPMAPSSVAPPAEAATDALARVQGELRSLRAGLDGLRAAADDDRQTDALRGLRRAVDALKQEVEGAKSASANAVGQLGARIERLDREPDPKGGDARTAEARLAEAKAAEIRAAEAKAAEAKAAEARVAQVASQLNARLDRLERQMASGDATGSIPRDAAGQLKASQPPTRAAQATAPPAAQPFAQPSAQPVAQASASSPIPQAVSPAAPAPAVTALPPPRPELLARADPALPPRQPEAPPRPATVDGWLLRDVYGGVALVEGRAGGLREVAPGEYVPGVGEIRSIERRGRGWVVVTSRGLIQADNRW